MSGIMFKSYLIPKIIDGTKTHTRRLQGLKEINQEPDKWRLMGFNGTEYIFGSTQKPLSLAVKARYKLGETMYIREAWATDKIFDTMSSNYIEALGVASVPLWYKIADDQLDNPLTKQGRWRFPRFMPQWAARTFIKILSVEAKRLQDMDEADARAEGFDGYDDFVSGWDVINKNQKWNTNPWCFDYSFCLTDKKA